MLNLVVNGMHSFNCLTQSYDNVWMVCDSAFSTAFLNHFPYELDTYEIGRYSRKASIYNVSATDNTIFYLPATFLGIT